MSGPALKDFEPVSRVGVSKILPLDNKLLGVIPFITSNYGIWGTRPIISLMGYLELKGCVEYGDLLHATEK